MSYSKKVYELADNELRRRRDNALAVQKQHHDEAAAKLPELLKIEYEMAQTGLSVIKALGRGEDAQAFIEMLSKKNLDAQEQRKILLVSAGFPQDYLKAKFCCPVCEDKGFINGKSCECRKFLLRTLAFSMLCENLPLERSGFDRFSLDFYPNSGGVGGVTPYKKMSQIYDFCFNYANDFGTDSPNLFMHGATGLGKTHLSLAIAGCAANNGFGVIYGSAQNLLNKLEKEHFGRSQSEDDTLTALLECDLLILDDLGTEFSTAFTVSAIYNIINSRLLSELPTIISTNLTPEELEQKYTQRITSRIIGNYISLQFCGRDVRQLL